MTYFSDVNFSAVGMASYGIATDTWTKEPDPPTSRRNQSVAIVNGRIYTIGGTRPELIKEEDWKGIDTVEEFTPKD